MQPKGWQGSQKKQNCMRNFVTKLKFMVWFNMEAIPKSDIKYVIKSGIRFDINIKLITWIRHESV